MQAIPRLFFLMFLTLMPVVGAFSIGALITLPFVSSLFLMLLLPFVATKNNKILSIPREIYIYMLFLFYCTASFAINIEAQNAPKSVNHFVSMLYTGCLFLVLYCYIHNFWEERKTLAVFLLLGMAISVFFGFFEYYYKGILGHTTSLIPRAEREYYYPIFLKGFYRIRSVSSESGHYASYLIPILLVFHYLSRDLLKRWVKNSISILCILSIILTFSFAGVVFFTLSYLIYSTVIEQNNISKKRIISIFAKFCFVLFGLISIEILFNYILGHSFINDFFLSKFIGYSAQDRLGRVIESYDLFVNGDLAVQFFGLGPAYFYRFDVFAPVSLYFTILFQYGILGLILFVTPLISLLIRLKKRPACNEKKYLSIAVIYLLLHFSSISNYWYPWLWFTLSFALVYLKKSSRNE